MKLNILKLFIIFLFGLLNVEHNSLYAADIPQNAAEKMPIVPPSSAGGGAPLVDVINIKNFAHSHRANSHSSSGADSSGSSAGGSSSGGSSSGGIGNVIPELLPDSSSGGETNSSKFIDMLSMSRTLNHSQNIKSDSSENSSDDADSEDLASLAPAGGNSDDVVIDLYGNGLVLLTKHRGNATLYKE